MTKITISKKIAVTPHQAFETYLSPEDNARWSTAGQGWSTGVVSIDARVGGEFSAEYRSPDGADDFVVVGKYTEFVPDQLIEYEMDGRTVRVEFTQAPDSCTTVAMTFDAETENSPELQQAGWQAILDNFAAHVTRKYDPKNVILTKKIEIAAPVHTVWQILTQDQYYRQWATAFCPGSYFLGEMIYSHKIQFLAPDLSGLSSIVQVAIIDFQVSFEHLGAIIAGKEDLQNTEFAGWKGARETYTITEINGATQLEVYQEINKKESKYMARAWDNALTNIQKLAVTVAATK